MQVGNNQNRLLQTKVLQDAGYNIPALIHPTAYVSPDAEIAPGCIIRAKVVVSRYVKLGLATILNVGALIDHDVEIGEGSHILMGAVVRNMVKLPAMSRVESNQVVE
jgi:UDP-3-O-[3-hydroxymyristoyl] glucosamine N-acyltransferase